MCSKNQTANEENLVVFIQKTQDREYMLNIGRFSFFPHYLIFLEVFSETKYQFDTMENIKIRILFYHFILVLMVASVLCLAFLKKLNLLC
jgi:hypothetical protein